MKYIIYNGNIVDSVKDYSDKNAILINDGKIEEIFCFTDSDNKFSDLKKIDLKNKTIIPGLIDSHLHFLEDGMKLTSVNLEDVKSISDILEKLKDYINSHPEAEIIAANGLEINNLKEMRYPTKNELDKASKSKYVYISRRDGHSCIINSKLLNLLKELENKPEISYKEEYENGILRGKINYFLSSKVFSMLNETQIITAYIKAAEFYNSRGVTSINGLIGFTGNPKRDYELFKKIEDSLSLDVVPFYQSRDIKEAHDLGIKHIGGCLALDGSISSRTTAISYPYAGTESNYGILYFKDEELEKFFYEANERDLQITIHAIGDRAIEQALRLYEQTYKRKKFPRNFHRIEHFELPSEKQIEKTAELGLMLGMQPIFEYLWSGENGMYAKSLGLEKAKKSNPLRKILDQGIIVGGSSDAPVTQVNPLLGIQAASNRKFPEHNLTLKESLQLFTINNAELALISDRKGSLEKGKDADFVILEKNLFDLKPSEIDEKLVSEVYRKGKSVFKK